MEYWKLIKEIGSTNGKWEDSVQVKADIIDRLIKNIEPNSQSILFAKFNPVALALSKKYNVTMVCDKSITDYFDLDGIKRFDSIKQTENIFDIVIALDEYFTYADSEDTQRQLIEEIAGITNGWLITTLQDYKNFAPYKKNQIEAFNIVSDNNYIMLENSIADKLDKQLWDHYWYCIKDHTHLFTIGPNRRRTMYFKQMAKYSSDAGSKQYVIQKNLLYKGFFSRNFEHIITVNFG
jgi:hypothetical protein